MKKHHCLSLIAVLVLTACGGGGGDNNSKVGAPSDPNGGSEVPALNPQVTLTASTKQAIIGKPYTLNWGLKDVNNCSLSGAIEQTVINSGSWEVTPTQQGPQKTTITCGSVSDSITVEVLPEFVEVPDPIFADALSRLGYPVHNGEMATLDALAIDKLCITSIPGYYGQPDENNTAIFDNTSVPDSGVRCAYTDGYITDATGLEKFLNLRTIRLELQQIKQINISTLQGLQFLSLWGEPIINIDLTKNTELVSLGLSETSLTTVDTSSLVKLEEAAFTQGERQVPYYLNNGTLVQGFSKVDFSKNQNIQRVYLNYNPLTDFGISNNKNSLRELWAFSTNVESLDLSGYKLLNYILLNKSQNLNHLNVFGVNNDAVPFRLNVTEAPNLTEIIVKNKADYTKARDEGKIYIDPQVNIVEGP